MAMLQAEGVSKFYGEYPAVQELSFEVQPGEIYGLLGANGAGKTTTMRMALGLIYPDQGRILWNGKHDPQKLAELMGYLPEERGLYPKIKVSEQIIYLAELRGMKRKQAEHDLKVWLERFEVPEYYDKKVEELSKGNQQKIQLIAAVIHDPQILILDEAFSGLDPVNVEMLKKYVKILRDEGKTILFSSHRMDHVEELCESVTIMKKGSTVLQGKIKEMKRAFPREKVLLNTEDKVQGLAQIRGVTAVIETEQGYELTISDAAAAQDILQEAMKQSAVNNFQIMEPSLHEIFIKVVGGAV